MYLTIQLQVYMYSVPQCEFRNITKRVDSSFLVTESTPLTLYNNQLQKQSKIERGERKKETQD